MKRYKASELRALPTLCVAQADNLKIDTGSLRVWLCRCGVADGMPYDEQITIERLIDGRWIRIAVYPGNVGAPSVCVHPMCTRRARPGRETCSEHWTDCPSATPWIR